MELSIIIVNYKTPQLIIDCLRSIFTFSPDIPSEIIVVDNHSGDNSRELITAKFPSIRWVQQDYNSGFARANNEGIRQAKGDAVLLLNSDTLVKDDAIARCYSQLMASEYVAAGVQLLNADGTPQISGSYFMKGGLNHLLPLPYVGKLLKAIAGFFKVKKPNVPNATGIVEVDWINGAFLMVKRSAFEKAGLMDEDFFLYAEETEWCSRLRKLGKLCLFGNCNVIHLQGATTNEAFNSEGQGYMNIFDKKGFQILISNILRVRKQFGVGWFLLHLFVLLGTIPVFFIGLLLSKIFTGGRARYNWKQFSGFCRNVFGIVKYSGRIIQNKPHFYKVL